MASKVLTVRADPTVVDAWQQAADEAGMPLGTWMREILTDVVDAMGLTGHVAPIEGQLTVDELAAENTEETSQQEPPLPEIQLRPLDQLGQSPQNWLLPPQFGGIAPGLQELKTTCHAAHLHFRLARGETCMFCGGQP